MKHLILLLSLNLILLANYTIKEGSNLDNISKSKEWNQLLYIKDNESEVNSKEFFLNKTGSTNPKEELLATLKAYSTVANDKSAVCIYPARYMFLSKFVNFDNYQRVNPNCKKLSNWEFLNETNSISLVLVSGYVSNPASTFGHSFIKLNKANNNNLFSSSVNYGALVPENESTLAYIAKGLTGFYQAGFSDKYFYTQDLTYTDTEFRDMWEYKLNLTQDQKKFLLLHIWEIVGKKYDYYFLNKNCGYRVTEILNLVTKSDFLDSNSNWFLPVETFSKLEKEEPELISEIKFIPSNKRLFNAHMSNLTKDQRDSVKLLIRSNFNDLKDYNQLIELDKIKILDFLMLYYKQSLTVDSKNKKLQEIKQKILTERFKYGISKEEKVTIKKIPSPAKNTNPINVEAALGYDSINHGFMAISFSPYKQSSLGISNLDYDNLITLDTRIGVSKEKIFLDKFDFIKINKRNLDTDTVLEEFKYNWNVHIGINNFNDRKKHFANAGVGMNLFQKEDILIYSSATGSINDSNHFSVIPSIGVELKYDKMKLRLVQEKEVGILKNESLDITNLDIKYNINKDFYLGYELKYIENEYKNLVNMKINF